MKNAELLVHMLGAAGVRWATACPQPNFGVPCRSARDEESLREAIDWGLTLSGPSVIETFIDVEPYSLTVFD